VSQDGPRVLFFGDSLVAGVGDPTGLGWVGRIVAASFAAGTSLTAYNLGVRRDTSEQVAARWRSEALPRLAGSTDSRIVLSFGANDTAMEDGRLRVTPDQSTRALTTMLTEINDLGLSAFVVGPAPVDDAEHNARLRDLSGASGATCRQFGVSFVSVLGLLASSGVWRDEVSEGDGAHPGAAGYQLLANLICDGGLLAWLESG